MSISGQKTKGVREDVQRELGSDRSPVHRQIRRAVPTALDEGRQPGASQRPLDQGGEKDNRFITPTP